MNRFAAVLLVLSSLTAAARGQRTSTPPLGHRNAPLLHVEGLTFKDLNHNGRLDPYEDWRLTPAQRTRDLLSQLTLEEIAGLMVHATVPSTTGLIGAGTTYDFSRATGLIQQSHITTFLTRLSPAPQAFAEQNNRLQEIAEDTRLGIPLTLSTDPRNSFLYTPGASVQGSSFSKWPETTGLAAIGSPALVRTFADVVRQEYRAVGIREALSPQADLATEPRWPRLNGTFGEDAETARALVQAYVTGIQNGGSGLNARSVSAVVKHWVGYGAQKDGFDSHNSYGRTAELPGNSLALHIVPFTGAFAADVAAVMPTYSILDGPSIGGKPLALVGGAFDAPLLTGLLRGTYRFDGVILSDWNVTNDCTGICLTGVPASQRPDFANIGMPWGVESLNKEQRFAIAVNAGVDQIGGSDEPHFLLDALQDGLLTRARLEESAYRILLQKFQLGLFEDPYVDAANTRVVGNPDFVRQATDAQKRALVLLQNRKSILPLHAAHQKIFLYGVDPAAAERHGFLVVSSPEDADLAVIRAQAPFESLHPGYTFGSIQHEGRLDFRVGDPAYDALVRASAHEPVIITVYLDRPAILTNVVDKAAAVLGNFGISDDALFDVLVGATAPQGHLPFELPSSMEAVRAQRGDLPHDSAQPLFPYGYGLLDFDASRPASRTGTTASKTSRRD